MDPSNSPEASVDFAWDEIDREPEGQRLREDERKAIAEAAVRWLLGPVVNKQKLKGAKRNPRGMAVRLCVIGHLVRVPGWETNLRNLTRIADRFGVSHAWVREVALTASKELGLVYGVVKSNPRRPQKRRK